MTREQKAEVIDFLTSEFKGSDGIVFCDFKGMTVEKIESFRKVVAGIDGRTQVVKNTLASIALKNAGVEGMELTETNLAVRRSDPAC